MQLFALFCLCHIVKLKNCLDNKITQRRCPTGISLQPPCHSGWPQINLYLSQIQLRGSIWCCFCYLTLLSINNCTDYTNSHKKQLPAIVLAPLVIETALICLDVDREPLRMSCGSWCQDTGRCLGLVRGGSVEHMVPSDSHE